MAFKQRRILLLVVVFVFFNIGLVFAILYLAKQAENYKTDEQTNIAQQCMGLELPGKCFDLERTDTNEARMRGLSGRDSLPENTGMLFVFEYPKNQCFWMKEMKFNIDIVWLNQDKVITKLEKNVSPATYPNTFCSDDTKYVLEFNSGFADKQRLVVGQKLNL